MVKKFKLTQLDCAHCAEKMEREIQKIDGVNSATIAFMTSRLTIDADENRFDEILVAAQKAISKIEKDCKIEVRS